MNNKVKGGLEIKIERNGVDRKKIERKVGMEGRKVGMEGRKVGGKEGKKKGRKKE